MSHCKKLDKLIDRMQRLVNSVGDQKDLAVHRHVNQFFYMQKIEELRVLLDRFDELSVDLEAVSLRIHSGYDLCLDQWRRDARWLNAHNLQVQSKSVL